MTYSSFSGKLQPPRSVPVCGMRVFAGFVVKIFGHFRPAIRYGSPMDPFGSRDLHDLLPIYSCSIWHKAFDLKCRVLARIWRNPQQQKHSPACCSNSGPHPRHTSLKRGWRHENKIAHQARRSITPQIKTKDWHEGKFVVMAVFIYKRLLFLHSQGGGCLGTTGTNPSASENPWNSTDGAPTDFLHQADALALHRAPTSISLENRRCQTTIRTAAKPEG